MSRRYGAPSATSEQDPLRPITKLQENLERRFNREFEHQYLAKLAEKVARQTLVEIDRAQIEQRMAFTRENYRMVREKLMEIMYWDKDAPQPNGRRKNAT